MKHNKVLHTDRPKLHSEERAAQLWPAGELGR
jgi:hypothetical protein